VPLAFCHNPFMFHRSRRFPSLAALVATAALAAGCGSAPQTASPSATAMPSATAPEPEASPAVAATPSPTLAPTPSPTPAPVPFVPVADFRSSDTKVDATALAAIAAGTNKTYASLEVVSSDAAGILAALQLDPATLGARLVKASTAAALESDLAAHHDRLGMLRASQVGPGVRALAWGSAALFGVGRVTSLESWPLNAALDAGTGSAFDPSLTWTAAAGGDIMLDRGVYKVLVTGKKGPDYPFNGGTVAITGRYCCSTFDWVVPRSKVVDSTPVVRNLFSGANLAMANLEGPAPVNARYHADGMTFTFQQSLLVGLKNAGLDVVSMANNHIGNAGKTGIVQTAAALDKLGIAHAGAGPTRTVADTPAYFTIDGVKVAFLGFSAFGGYAAGLGSNVAADIKAARKAGAQVVITYPHWGTEYKANPNPTQVRWAHAMIDAGADIVIGNHPHEAEGMEVYKGKPIWYGLGNFVFDQDWSEFTQEALLLELTFNGPNLVQAWMHPILIENKCQPNFLDAASGQVVLNQVFSASKGKLPW